jgi:hypothetical protein
MYGDLQSHQLRHSTILGAFAELRKATSKFRYVRHPHGEILLGFS